MESVLKIFPVLMVVSTGTTLVAFFFLQSRAKGVARILIVLGGLVSVIPSTFVSFITNRSIFHGILAAGTINVGLILLGIGIIQFVISLPSKRLDLKAEDEREVSSRIIEEMNE